MTRRRRARRGYVSTREREGEAMGADGGSRLNNLREVLFLQNRDC